MITNYFKIGLRILIRQRSYTILNIAGLAIGIAVFVFIYLYIQSEIRYDRHWTGSDRIYRIWNEYAIDGNIQHVAVTPYLLSNKLKSNFKGVEESTMIFFTDPSDVNDMSSLMYEDEIYEIPDITLSNEDLFNIFDYTLVEGDPKTALKAPNSMVITTEVAKEIFGDEPAVGKKLRTIIREYTITGVIDKHCRPSHITFDAVVSASSLDKKDFSMMDKDWFWLNCYTYVKLADTVDVESFEKRFNAFAMSEIKAFIDSAGVKIDGYTRYNFEPVGDVHFNTSLAYDSPSNIDYTSLVIFGIIAGFILLTASINYINLAMARSLKRAKEVGVRKVLGAQRKQLTMQHISESFIVTLFAFIIALSLVEFLMPQFNQLIGRELTLVGTLFTREGIFFGLGLILMIILLAVISGIFPAFILSTFNPANVLKGNNFFFNFRGRQKISAGGIRKVLVTVQYIVSAGMIIATAIIFAQMNFLKKHDLGYDIQDVLVINTPDDTTYHHRSEEFTQKLKDHPGITAVSSTMNVPGYTTGKLMFHVGDTGSMGLQTLDYFAVDQEFFETLGILLIEGRGFEKGMMEDTVRKYIINEAAAKYLKLEKPLGTKMDATLFEQFNGEIVGVVNDFHTVSEKQVYPGKIRAGTTGGCFQLCEKILGGLQSRSFFALHLPG
ncbi:MAG: ABC transporter permease [bacterium]